MALKPHGRRYIEAYSAGQTVHLQIKAEQKEIIQNVLERKDSMTECYQRASERACVTFPLFGQGITTFFFLMVISRFCLRSYYSAI
jgi:hypothetical protein